jgi:hypothetical protein
MSSLLILARWEGFTLLGGFFGIVFWKLMTGGISLNHLLEGDVRQADGSNSIELSAGRSQLLLLTLFSSLYYLLRVIHSPQEFPKLPNALVGALAGSQALYLAGKAKAMLIGRSRDFFNRRMP